MTTHVTPTPPNVANSLNGNLTGSDFQKIKSIFNTVVDLPEHEREQALARLTDDVAVIARVRSILAESATDSNTIAYAISAASGSLAAGMETPELASGDIVGAWKLVEEIGRGGMGSVFLVERSDGHFQQRAALKLLAGFASAKAQEHLARERQILAALSHPNIARLLDGGATPRGRPYLVLEHVNGQAIDKYCSDKKLSIAQIITLYITVCDTVAFAHRQLVVHCDLKPSNILISNEGRPVLLDFGVSRLLSEAAKEKAETAPLQETSVPSAAGASATQTSAAYTPRYASPEQKTGSRVGLASDVYSLGVMLAELLGVKTGSSEPAKFDAPNSSTLNLSGLNPDLTAIIRRATAATPADRYTGADALAADLHRALTHQPVAAHARTPAYIGKKFVRRNWPWLVGASAFVITVGGFSWRTVIERDNAVKAERASREVKDYMIAVFQGADPEVSGQRDLPVSALLDAGRERMATRLKDQPETRAEMSGILGSVYQNIGKREQALKLFDEAIEIERGNNRPAVLADLLYKKAFTIYDMEDFPKAEPLALEVLKLRTQTAPVSEGMVKVLQLVGLIASYQGKYKEADANLSAALSMAISLTDENSTLTGSAQVDFARHLVNVDGGDKLAEKYARNARQTFLKNLGSEAILYVEALEILVVALGVSGRNDEAIPIAREMSEKRTKLYGEVSNQNGFGLSTHANALYRAGRPLEAIPLLERCITIQEKLDGRQTLAITYPMMQLVRSHISAGGYDQALLLARELVGINSKFLEPSDVNVLASKYELVEVLLRLRKLDEVERIGTELLRLREANPKTQQWHLGQSKLQIATLLRLQGKYGEAADILASTEKMQAFAVPYRHAKIVWEKGRLAIARGEYEEALALFVKAETLDGGDSGVAHPDTWLFKLDRAELLAKIGQRESARELAKQIAINAKASIDPNGVFAKQLGLLTK